MRKSSLPKAARTRRLGSRGMQRGPVMGTFDHFSRERTVRIVDE